MPTPETILHTTMTSYRLVFPFSPINTLVYNTLAHCLIGVKVKWKMKLASPL